MIMEAIQKNILIRNSICEWAETFSTARGHGAGICIAWESGDFRGIMYMISNHK
jgi:hypothetical protein